MVIDIKEDSLKVKAGRNTALVFFLFVFALLIPFIIVNSSKALQTQDNLFIFLFYAGTIAIPLIYILISDFTQSSRKGSWTSIFNSYGHNPSDGWFSILFGKDEPKTFKTISKSVFIMFWFSLIFSLIISFFYILVQTGSLYYQGTPSALDKLPVSSQLGQIILAVGGGFTEELIFSGCMLGILFGLSLYLSKGNKVVFMIYEILGLAIALASVVFYHWARYGNSESALLGVASLFFISFLVVKITGSILFGLLLHPILNMTWKASQLFQTSEVVLLWMIGIVLVTFITSTIIYIVRQKSYNKLLINEATI